MLTQKHTVDQSQRMIFFKSRNLQHRNLLRDKLRAKMVIRATALFNLQRNNVARQVVRKCCPYYLTFMHPRNFGGDLSSRDRTSVRPHHRHISVKQLNQQVWQPKCNSRLFWREIAWLTSSCEVETIKESINTK